MSRVAVDVLTGFLGSGKTTLLKHVLGRGLDGRRVAVVVNEIGEIGIDGREIPGDSVERMVELTSGCVCCQVNFEFAAAMGEILETVRPDLIVIETTGLADPFGVASEVEGIGLMLDAILTVVDAASIEEHLAASPVVARQIRAADFLILNKTDLTDESAERKARRRLGKLNDRAPVFPTVRGRLPHSVPFGTSARSWRDRLEAADPDHLARDGISAFTWRSEGAVDRDRFERALRKLPRTLYRAKGIVRFPGASWPSLFSLAGGRVEFRFVRLPEGAVTGNQGVFIGADVERSRESILGALGKAVVS